MHLYSGAHIALTIDLPGGLYLALIMYCYREPQTYLTISLPDCL
jgi:hypothetical protein